MIHEVYPDGAAAIDGRLKPGDQVMEVGVGFLFSTRINYKFKF